MPNNTHNYYAHSTIARFTLALLLACATLVIAQAQQSAPREHLTASEIELVRDEQRIDRRTDLFVKAIERRLLLLNGNPTASQLKQQTKDAEKYGEIPQSTPAQLVGDIAGILEEAITNIDDSILRPQQKKFIPQALRKLAEASGRFQAQLVPLRETFGKTAARERLESALENIEEITQAAKRNATETTTGKQ